MTYSFFSLLNPSENCSSKLEHYTYLTLQGLLLPYLCNIGREWYTPSGDRETCYSPLLGIHYSIIIVGFCYVSYKSKWLLNVNGLVSLTSLLPRLRLLSLLS